MQLQRLLRDVTSADVADTQDIEILDITYDSRQVSPGALFVAVPSVGAGPESGGTTHIHEAVARGAVAVVTESDTEVDGISTIRVPDARTALADLAAEYFGHPSKQLNVFAVTGTDGKTTTSYLLEAIASAAGYTTGMIGTIETKIGERREPNPERMTTPESLDVQRLLRTMVDTGVTHVALEASSHALALQRLRCCRVAASALTNITGDHVEFHGSWEAYLEAKSRLFTEVGRGAPAVLNRDDASYDVIRPLVHGPHLTYSVKNPADIEARSIELRPLSSGFELTAQGNRSWVDLPLRGLFNVSNSLAAAGLALSAGIPVEDVARGLSEAQPPRGRMQRVSNDRGVEVVVDYAHTVNGFRSVLSTLRATTPGPGRLIAVFGAAGGRDRQKRPTLAQIAREFADYAIITNEDPFGEEATEIMAQIAAGLPPGEEGVRFHREPDRARAIEMALELARPGDTVAVLGKGHEQSIAENGRSVSWSDVEVVRAALGVHA